MVGVGELVFLKYQGVVLICVVGELTGWLRHSVR